MNTNVIGHKISTAKFTWIAQSKEFLQEISILQHGGCNVFGPLYNDACDQGFVLVSHLTGVEHEFVLFKEHRDGDGETRFWEFRPTPASIRRQPKIEGYTVIVDND